MNELIKVNYDNSDLPTVLGRELHDALGIKTPYKQWFDRMCEYGFTEKSDYVALTQKSVTAQGNEITYVDHQLTLDMAKELCMLQRTEIGIKCRKYFVAVEKQWNDPEAVMARALKIANQKLLDSAAKITMLTEQNNQLTATNAQLDLQNKQQAHEIDQLKPIAAYAQIVLSAPGLMNTNQIAKDYGKSAVWLNRMLNGLGVQYKQNDQWLLYAKYADNGYTHTKLISITKPNGVRDMKPYTMWTQKGRMFIYELLKKNGIVPMIERS